MTQLSVCKRCQFQLFLWKKCWKWLNKGRNTNLWVAIDMWQTRCFSERPTTAEWGHLTFEMRSFSLNEPHNKLLCVIYLYLLWASCRSVFRQEVKFGLGMMNGCVCLPWTLTSYIHILSHDSYCLYCYHLALTTIPQSIKQSEPSCVNIRYYISVCGLSGLQWISSLFYLFF